MKSRYGFVSNSSSSSFVLIKAGNTTILEDGDDSMECCGSVSVSIDDIIEKLLAAKASGETMVRIEHGGGYDG